MTVYRVSSFNVENLFTRPRVLNLADDQKTADLLAKIAEFTELIRRKSYAGKRRASSPFTAS